MKILITAVTLTAGLTVPGEASWGACPPDSVDLGQKCTTVSVPLDYDKPTGEKISLAVSRIPAARPDLRRGVLLLIPGGPGNPGLDRPWKIGAKLPQEVKDRYDIIGFDPRGTGQNQTLSCGLSRADLTDGLSSWPAPNGDITEDVVRAKRIAEACARNAGPLIQHLSTANEVKDIEQIRKFLGERKISYWAHSYGTYVGAVYATLYGNNTDRVLLDSMDEPDPEVLWRNVLLNTGQAVEDRFPDFARYASQPGQDHVADTPAAVRALYLSLAAKLDQEPIGEFTGDSLRAMVLRGMNSDAGFPAIAQTMIAARDGKQPPKMPTPPENVLQNIAAVAGGVVCNDVAWPRSVSVYQRDVLRNREEFPMTAGMPASITPCAFWPFTSNKPVRITPHGPSNMLLIQSLRDPSTPYVGAVKMRQALGQRARMVTVESGGHGVYLQQGNTCGNDLVTWFLVSGQRPAQDVRCPR